MRRYTTSCLVHVITDALGRPASALAVGCIGKARFCVSSRFHWAIRLRLGLGSDQVTVTVGYIGKARFSVSSSTDLRMAVQVALGHIRLGLGLESDQAIVKQVISTQLPQCVVCLGGKVMEFGIGGPRVRFPPNVLFRLKSEAKNF